MIFYIFIFLAAFFNSVMDAVENKPNFDESIFRKLPRQFWLKEESWKYVKKILGYRPDAWHLSKTLMVICFALAVIFFDMPVMKWQDVELYLVLIGIIWNGAFWLFYNLIFKVK